MSDIPRFMNAWPYAQDVLALPVADVDAAVDWYGRSFGLTEVSRTDTPCNTVLMERDGVQLGFAENGGDSSQDGAAILVHDITGMRDELVNRGVEIGNWRVDERDGEKLQVFFVAAPDGLCYYFHEPVAAT